MFILFTNKVTQVALYDSNPVITPNGIAGFDDDEIKRIQSLRSVVSYEALEYFLKETL